MALGSKMLVVRHISTRTLCVICWPVRCPLHVGCCAACALFGPPAAARRCWAQTFVSTVWRNCFGTLVSIISLYRLDACESLRSTYHMPCAEGAQLCCQLASCPST